MYSPDDAPFGVINDDYKYGIVIHLGVHFSVPLQMNTSVVVSAFRVDDDVSIWYIYQ